MAETNSCGVGAFAHRVEIDETLDQFLQWIDVERIEIVRRQILRDRFDPDRHRRIFQRQKREQAVDGLALQVGQAAAEAGGAPEIGEALARFIAPAARQSVGEQHGVDRAGGRAGDALDLEPPVIEQVIEHAPAERAIGAAALQREIDALCGGAGAGSPRMVRTMDLIMIAYSVIPGRREAPGPESRAKSFAPVEWLWIPGSLAIVRRRRA